MVKSQKKISSKQLPCIEMHNMFQKIVAVFCFIIFGFFIVTPVSAQSSVTMHLFYGEGCPHCAKEQEFLKKLKETYPQIDLKEYEIYYNKENSALLKEVSTSLQTSVGGVPFLVVGNEFFVGFSQTRTQEIESAVQACIAHPCEDSVEKILADSQKDTTPIPSSIPEDDKEINKESQNTYIFLPIFGDVKTASLSLPVLTLVLAFLDGFNPCAMWTLLFLISLLLGMKDRKRMWILGIAFIASSAAVYFLFLSAWLNFFLFLGFVSGIRIVIGIVALGAAFYYLRDFWINRSGGCNVMGNEKRQNIFHQLREITQKRQLFLALGGIILLAIAVNMVELVCSAGLPAIYTQVLSLSNLSRLQYYLYLLLYVFIFMLDDLFVFFTAMLTLQAVGVQSKYARYSHFIGGILMFIIGLLLLFKPEWLMFG